MTREHVGALQLILTNLTEQIITADIDNVGIAELEDVLVAIAHIRATLMHLARRIPKEDV